MLKNSKILITGGTGTLGRELARQLADCKEVVIFSRNEVAQVEMKRKYPKFKYVMGDVRDDWAVDCVMRGVNYVFHLAAVKSVPICEQQPQEALQTNVIGTLNVVREAIKKGVTRVVNMSTDKAVEPSSFYGLTKAISEKVVLNANDISNTEFINIRSGNIFGSSGSVIPFFVKQVKEKNCITLTDGNMTRFFISTEDIAKFLIKACEEFKEGETYAPENLKSFKMSDVAEVAKELYGNEDTLIKEIGIREGEKMHECLNGISSEEVLGTKEDLTYLFMTWTG